MKESRSTASLLFALAACSLVIAQNVQRPRAAGEDFAERFKQSYIAVSSREPQVTQLEKEILDKLATMIESNPTYAKTFLADILGDDKPVSAAFNHALGNLYVLDESTSGPLPLLDLGAAGSRRQGRGGSSSTTDSEKENG